ncbi:MAG: hypothetical protein JO180_01520, partial [Gemmatirosa sp.]|nr:hypothetical protein [Gemmatirosa sp.]
MSTIAAQVMTFLGGPGVVGQLDSEYDLVDAVRQGLPVEALDDLLGKGL